MPNCVVCKNPVTQGFAIDKTCYETLKTQKTFLEGGLQYLRKQSSDSNALLDKVVVKAFGGEANSFNNENFRRIRLYEMLYRTLSKLVDMDGVQLVVYYDGKAYVVESSGEYHMLSDKGLKVVIGKMLDEIM